MQNNGTSLGAPFTLPITVGAGGNTGTINVVSEMDGTQTPVPAGWVLSGDFTTSTVGNPTASASYATGIMGDDYSLGGIVPGITGVSLKEVRSVGFAEAHKNVLTGLLAMLKESLGEPAYAMTVSSTQCGLTSPDTDSAVLYCSPLTFQIDWTATPTTTPSAYACSENSCIASSTGAYSVSDCNSACGSHLACQGDSCVSFPGGGSNQDGCTTEGQSCSGGSHLECQNNSCTSVSGGGTDQCSTIGDACSGPSLSATLSAYPTSGDAPLATTLTANAANGTGGTYNYTFWQDCSYSGTSVSDATTACGTPTKKDDSVSATTDTASVTYSDAQTYHPLVIVENGSSAVQATASVTTTGGCTGNCTHLECGSGSVCISVSGSGSDQCVAEGDACIPPVKHSHLACQNDSCVAVSGSGTDQCSTDSDCAPKPPSCTFGANSATPIVPPEAATLSWTCSNVNSCSIDQGVGTVNSPSGSVSVDPTSTTVYTLNCNGSTWTASVLVNNPGQIEINP
jgi:hypothetical protein